MNNEQKELLYSLRKCIERGDIPTNKTLWKLIDMFVAIDRDLAQAKALLDMQIADCARLEERLHQIKQTVAAKVEEAFI